MSRHEDPEIDAFLADGGYESIEAWMEDSDYYRGEGGLWYNDEGIPQGEPEDCIAGAMEACEFEVFDDD